MNKQEFIDAILPGAYRAYENHNIMPSLTLAQAVLESGWGSNAPGNMLFGVKWQEGCGYERQLLWTSEFIDGQWQRVQDWFRAYNDMNDSIYDHEMFLVENSRYAPVFEAKDYRDAATLIRQCGYATDPDYTDKLIGIIEYYNFQLYDRIAKFNKSVKILNGTDGQGPIRDTQYWIEKVITELAIDPEFMKTIILRFVAMYVNVDTYEQAVDILVQYGIVGDKSYWVESMFSDGYTNPIYAEIVLNRMAYYMVHGVAA